jgi:hypothetical protein
MNKRSGPGLTLFIAVISCISMYAQDGLNLRVNQDTLQDFRDNGPDTPCKASGNYHKVLADALLLQLKADSLARIVRDKRLLARDTPDDEMKKLLVHEIIRSEEDAKNMQHEADRRFSEARNLRVEPAAFRNQADSLIELSKEINGIRVYQYKYSTLFQSQEITATLPDGQPSPEPPDERLPVIADEFRLLEESPYNDSNPIPGGLEKHAGLIYRIQLGVFSKVKPNDAFGGMSPVARVQADGSSIIKYYVGVFGSLQSVTRALDQVRSKGFADAFIVAFFNGELIPTEKAREIEFAGYRL